MLPTTGAQLLRAARLKLLCLPGLLTVLGLPGCDDAGPAYRDPGTITFDVGPKDAAPSSDMRLVPDRRVPDALADDAMADDAATRDAATLDMRPPMLPDTSVPDASADMARDAHSDGGPSGDLGGAADMAPDPDMLAVADMRPDAANMPDATPMAADAAPIDAAPIDPDAAPIDPDAAPIDLDAAPIDLDAGAPPPLPDCPIFDDPLRVGAIGAGALNEASGMVASQRNRGVFWAHNDSDGGNIVYALGINGDLRSEVVVDVPAQDDWEDIAVGPGPVDGRTYVYVGDIGDNGANRGSIAVRRFREPQIGANPEPRIALDGAEIITLEYPDGAKNANAMLVDPDTGDVYVFAIANGRTPIYRASAPLDLDAPNPLVQVAELRFGAGLLPGAAATTGADISPSGAAILIRTEDSAFLWRRRPGASIAQALSTPPCAMPLAREGQGEAIAFAAEGPGFFTTSEGAGAPIYFVGPPGVVEPPVDMALPDMALPDMALPDMALPDAAQLPDMEPPVVLPQCPEFADPEVTGNLANPAIVEASGVAESQRNPGVLWINNDAGGTSRVFAIGTDGANLGVFELGGNRPRDFEDLSVGPGPGGQSYVYVADVGDNAIQRGEVQLRRFPEPVVAQDGGPVNVDLEGVEVFRMIYPDGPHNCESMMIDPRNGDLYLVTKSGDGVSPVYRAAAPFAADEPIRLEQVANLQFGAAPLGGNRSTTGGDISPAGDEILIRTYSAVFLWRRGPQMSIAEALMTPPCPMPRPRDRQGEAVCFAADGQGYYTVSEGAGTPVHFHARQ